MGPVLDTSFDIVAAIRLLAARIEALEERLVLAYAGMPEEEVRQAKPARPPKAKSETLEVSE